MKLNNSHQTHKQLSLRSIYVYYRNRKVTEKWVTLKGWGQMTLMTHVEKTRFSFINFSSPFETWTAIRRGSQLLKFDLRQGKNGFRFPADQTSKRAHRKRNSGTLCGTPIVSNDDIGSEIIARPIKSGEEGVWTRRFTSGAFFLSWETGGEQIIEQELLVVSSAL